jgi:hypothetical protein
MPARADDPKTQTVVRLSLMPQPEPRPALKHQLLPELREMHSGNTVMNFFKCFMEQQHFWFNKEIVAQREKYLTLALHELPAEELKNYGGWALRWADDAARLDGCDWQITHRLRTDGAGLLLPDLQQMRTLANGLKVRLRGEIKRCEFDQAIVTTKTLLALARCTGEHPTLIGELVGTAIAALTVSAIEEFVQQDGAPNLYWAIGYLPSPFIDIRKGLGAERLFIEAELDGVATTKDPIPVEKLTQQIQKYRILVAMFQDARDAKVDGAAWLETRSANKAAMAEVHKRLAGHGWTEEQLKALPRVQVALLDEIKRYESLRDDAIKWVATPFPKLPAHIHGEKVGVNPFRAEAPDDTLLGRMVPAVIKVRRAQFRLEQRLAMLRTVEAIRLHAVAHNGKLPQDLASAGVPVPDDPFTGRPFRYEMKNEAAVLQGSPPPGCESDATFNVRYEIMIRK